MDGFPGQCSSRPEAPPGEPQMSAHPSRDQPKSYSSRCAVRCTNQVKGGRPSLNDDVGIINFDQVPSKRHQSNSQRSHNLNFIKFEWIRLSVEFREIQFLCRCFQLGKWATKCATVSGEHEHRDGAAVTCLVASQVSSQVRHVQVTGDRPPRWHWNQQPNPFPSSTHPIWIIKTTFPVHFKSEWIKFNWIVR